MSYQETLTPFRSQRAIQPGHWYTRDGQAAFTVRMKDGRERATTLRDAKKFLWLPSVTTVQKMAAKPALERWGKEQVALACLTSPLLDRYQAGEVKEKDFLNHVFEGANEQARKAAELGVQGHYAIESRFLGEPVDERWTATADACFGAVQQICKSDKWMPESRFGNARLGFGGTIDLRLPAGIHPSRRAVIIDFKGKSFTSAPEEPREFMWPEMCGQLAAYDCGVHDIDEPEAILINIFFSREVPGLIHVAPAWGADEALRRWKQFRALTYYWQLECDYVPSSGGEA